MPYQKNISGHVLIIVLQIQIKGITIESIFENTILPFILLVTLDNFFLIQNKEWRAKSEYLRKTRLLGLMSKCVTEEKIHELSM